jgi:hypothetical protein
MGFLKHVPPETILRLVNRKLAPNERVGRWLTDDPEGRHFKGNFFRIDLRSGALLDSNVDMERLCLELGTFRSEDGENAL